MVLFNKCWLTGVRNPLSVYVKERPTNFFAVEMTITMVVKLGAVVYMTPVFVIPGLAIGVLGGWLGNLYVKAQLSVKREMSNARSPVFSHFNASIAGLRASLLSYHPGPLFTEIEASIRAYGAQEAFKQSSLTRIDKYTRSVKTQLLS
jgi:hypothetical protein